MANGGVNATTFIALVVGAAIGLAVGFLVARNLMKNKGGGVLDYTNGNGNGNGNGAAKMMPNPMMSPNPSDSQTSRYDDVGGGMGSLGQQGYGSHSTEPSLVGNYNPLDYGYGNGNIRY